jgi:hypothetical protein
MGDRVAGNVRERVGSVRRLLHSFVPSLVSHLSFIVCVRTYAVF